MIGEHGLGLYSNEQRAYGGGDGVGVEDLEEFTRRLLVEIDLAFRNQGPGPLFEFERGALPVEEFQDFRGLLGALPALPAQFLKQLDPISCVGLRERVEQFQRPFDALEILEPFQFPRR
ncbi:MAG: hypothetical protein KGK30_05555 [Elusimicrobia bacterium]|nr:hypothetical protein [Elusimicrobiota bacterium]